LRQLQSTGGILPDRTDDIHPENVWLAERLKLSVWPELISPPGISRPREMMA